MAGTCALSVLDANGGLAAFPILGRNAQQGRWSSWICSDWNDHDGCQSRWLIDNLNDRPLALTKFCNSSSRWICNNRYRIQLSGVDFVDVTSSSTLKYTEADMAMPSTHIPMRLGHISYLPVIGNIMKFANNNIITNFDSVLVALFNALANGSGHRFVPDSYIRTLYTGHIYKASKIKQDLLLVVSNSSSLQMASWKWRGMTQCFLLSRAALPASSRISAQGIRGWRRGDGGSGGRHVLTRRCKWGWWPWLRCGSCPAKCKKRKPLSRLHAKGLLCVIICCQKDR